MHRQLTVPIRSLVGIKCDCTAGVRPFGSVLVNLIPYLNVSITLNGIHLQGVDQIILIEIFMSSSMWNVADLHLQAKELLMSPSGQFFPMSSKPPCVAGDVIQHCSLQ